MRLWCDSSEEAGRCRLVPDSRLTPSHPHDTFRGVDFGGATGFKWIYWSLL